MTEARQRAGDTIREWRERAALTQDQVASAARELGLSWTRATVAAIEIGRRELSLDEFTVLRGAPVRQDELSAFFNRASVVRTHRGDTAEHLDAEMKAARKLGIEPAVIVAESRRLWGRTLTEERDFRVKSFIGIGDLVEHIDQMRARGLKPRQPRPGVITAARAVQARRGHITRALVEELQQTLKGKGRKR